MRSPSAQFARLAEAPGCVRLAPNVYELQCPACGRQKARLALVGERLLARCGAGCDAAQMVSAWTESAQEDTGGAGSEPNTVSTGEKTAPGERDLLCRSALAYAARGLRVFPCQLAKNPLTEHGVKDASIDAERVRAWWRRWPDASIGVATGGSIVVLDIDQRHGGGEALADLEHEHGVLAPTPTVLTGGGGEHRWFAMPAGTPIGNSAGALGPGLDIRGEGGYVIVPPSPHPSGRAYAWELSSRIWDIPFAPLPEWMIARLRGAHRASFQLPARVGAGQRNDTLYRLGRALRAKGMTEGEIRAGISSANTTRCEPPLDEDEIAQIAHSAMAPDRPGFGRAREPGDEDAREEEAPPGHAPGREEQPAVCNLSAERSVLSALMRDAGALSELKIEEGDFFAEGHRAIYRALRGISAEGQTTDVVSVAHWLSDAHCLEVAGGTEAIAEVASLAAPGADSLRQHAVIVRERAMRRRFIAEAGRLTRLASNSVAPEALWGEIAQAAQRWGAPSGHERGLPMMELGQLYAHYERWMAQEWVWDGILPRASVSLLVGKSESGKSTIIYRLIAAVARGEEFFGRRTCAGPVIYVAGDPVSEFVAARTFQELGLGDGDRVQVFAGALVATENGIARLAEAVRGCSPVLVVLDTLGTAVPIADSGSAQSVRAQQPLVTLARESGANLLLSHHSQKALIETYSVIDSALGTVGIAAVASTRMGTKLRKRRGRGVFYTFEMSKLRVGNPLEGEHVVVLLPGGRMELRGTWGESAAQWLDEDVERVIRAAGEPITRNQARLRLPYKAHTADVDDALLRLVAAFRVHAVETTDKYGRARGLARYEILASNEASGGDSVSAQAAPAGPSVRDDWGR